MKTLARILEEAESRSKGGLNEIQSRTLIGGFIVILLAVIYCLLWLLMRQCGRSANCQDNPGSIRTRSSAYKRVLEALPVIPYTLPSSAAETCAICLAEYEEGDSVRVLPRCNHFLHKECIDKWLLRSFQCPICRALVTQLKIDVHGDNTANGDHRIIRVNNVNDCPPVTSARIRSII